MDYYKIGEKVRKYRKICGLSQEQLAEKVGISVTHMSHIETGNTKLSLPVFLDITNALELQANDLLYDKNSERNISYDELDEILLNCSQEQLRIITDVVKTLKSSLDKYE